MTDFELTQLKTELGEALNSIRDLQDQLNGFNHQKYLYSLLHQATATLIGLDYFKALLTSITSTLNVKIAVITEQDNENPMLVQTVVLWKGIFLDPCPYDISGMPCEEVFATGKIVQAIKHPISFLNVENLETYIGFPLIHADGSIMGHFALFNDKPIDGIAEIIPILEIFAARASAELHHYKNKQVIEASESRFRAIFEQSPLGISITDVGGRIMNANPVLLEMLGYNFDELKEKSYLDITHPDDIEADLKLYNSIVRGEIANGTIRKRYLHKSGQIRWVNVTATLIYDSNGKPLYGVGMTEDITSRKAMENALEASENQFRTVFETAPVGMAIVERDGNFIQTNQAFQQMFDYSSDELSKMSPTDITLSNYSDKTSHLKRQRFNDHMVIRMERRYRRKNGEIIWCDTTAFDMRDEKNRFLAMLYFLVEITERKQIETQQILAYQTLEQQVAERTKEIERRRQIAASLRDILAILNSNEPLSDILHSVATQGSQLLEASGVAICFIDRDSNQIHLRANHVVEIDQINPINRLLKEPDRYQRLVNNEILTIPLAQMPQVEAGKTFCLLLVVPISVERKVDGCVQLYYDDRTQLTSEDRGVAITYSEQISMAIINSQLREKVKQAAAIEERNRLARDLHDAVSQTLWSASLIADILPSVWEQDANKGKAKLEQLKHLNSVALAEMRSLLVELRPVTLEQKSLVDTLQALIVSIRSRSGLMIDERIQCDLELPTQIKVTFYRIAQEALNNILKHASANKVIVSLQCKPDLLILEIVDNGLGFILEDSYGEHFGLYFMKERAQSVGAHLDISSEINSGTHIRLQWQVSEVDQ